MTLTPSKPVFPPPFTFRRSARAKRLALRFHPDGGLEIVLPPRVSEKNGLAFLQSQREWVEKHYHRAGVKYAMDDAERFALPPKIQFPAVNKTFPIDYRVIHTAKRITLHATNGRLSFYGNVSDFKPCIHLMTAWIKSQAKVLLPQLLEEVSIECDLPYRKVGVRGQKTLWGSCNSHKDIQLNYKLLLLPALLVRYVMIHELCHTVHLNHSKSFWCLLEEYMPNYKKYLSMLKNADQLLPRWL